MQKREIHVDQENDGMADYRPLRRVWAMCLHRGILDYCDQLAGKRDHHREDDCYEKTEAWFYDDERYEPGSFIWLCELLHYDPEYIRRHVEKNYQSICDKGQRGGRRSGGH